MSTPKNGFRDSDNGQSPSARLRQSTKTTTAWQKCGNDPLEDVFLKPMEKPWRSPPTNGGPPSCASSAQTMQMTSSTPLHFSPGLALSPAPISSATTRMSLDLFHKNAFKYQMEQSSRPSLTTDFALSALKNSFSMSSLSQQCHSGEAGTPADAPPSAAQHTPDVTARLKWERPFNSLTRLKQKGAGRVQWRRSFGASPLNVKEDAATLNASGSGGQTTANTDWLGNADYTFLMSCDLIESCRSVNGEMSWDNGDLEHLRVDEASARSARSNNNVNNDSVAVGCQTDAEVTIPDLQLELQLLREWLNRMEKKVPKLVLRPKWTRETLDRRIIDYKRLKREIEGHSAEFGAACQRCASRNPRIGRLLENRYHRLLLRILEWTYHLEALAKKPPEFWSGRRAAISSPESEVGLPKKHPRLDDSSSSSIHHNAEQVVIQAEKMRQSNAEGGLSPPLPVAVPVSRSNMGVYDFKHPDTDTENSLPQKPSAEEDVEGSLRKHSNLSDGLLVRSNDSSENEWIYSPNTSGRTADEMDGHELSVRKKLSFESEEDSASSSKSWFQYNSDESDWLQSGGLELDDASELEESLLPPPSAAADLPEESAHKDAARVYDKEKVHKLVTVAEQMVSMSGEACRNKNRKTEARYSNQEMAHNSECDASSELTSEAETDGEVQLLESPTTSGRRSATLNRTFLVPPGTDLADPSPVVLRTRHRIKPQRPFSFSGLSGTLAALSNNSTDAASGRWAASETALNYLSSPTLSPCSHGSRPLMCHASTQKDRLSPSTEGLGSSLAGLSSSGSVSAGGARQRRRRHSARLRNIKSRRGDQDAQPVSIESSNVTLQCRLSISAASSSGEGNSSAGGTGSQRSRRIVKSSTLTRISNETSAPLPIVANPVSNAQASPTKPPTPSTNSSPRSAPSDGELGLGHVDETSNFSEQAWDNYLEPYASEAYSEDPPDAESARRLLEFGEDYRNDLDSLSDCPSSLSTDLRGFRPHLLPKRSPPKRPKGFGIAERSIVESRVLDSDSDVEDLLHMVQTSYSQYNIALSTFQKALKSPKLEPSQYAELLATCRTNVQCLQPILSHLKMSEKGLDDNVPTPSNLKPVQDLVDQWIELGCLVSPLHQEGQQQRQLHQQVQSVRNKLLELETLVLAIGVDGDFQLNLNKIHQLKAQVESEKESLLQVNVDVHSRVVQQPTSTASNNLKEDVAGLYQTWERLTIKITEKEALLEEAERTWKEFQDQLLNLKAEIAADQQKVKSFINLQKSCDSLQTTPESSLEPCQSSTWMDNWSSIQLSVQCDSGISSGSDGEFISLGEREKRLHTLRQLARKLGAALAPGNVALMRINRTLDQTQQELTVLHNQLSQLPPAPVKTLSADTLISSPPVKEISVQTDPLLVPKKKERRAASAVASTTAAVCRTAVPYWWRIVKAALPFHLALIALLLAACFMEPSCCNYLNTFGSSFVPKLSYLGDPPPI